MIQPLRRQRIHAGVSSALLTSAARRPKGRDRHGFRCPAEVPGFSVGCRRDAALGRRAGWKYPEGIKVIAEYWPLSSAVQVISILAADSIEKIMEIFFEWDDVFDINIYPAVSAEEGLRIGPEVFARLPRMQQPG